MGLVLTICAVASLVITLTNTIINSDKRKIEEKGKKDIEDRMKDMNKKNTELEKVAKEQSDKIKANAAQIQKLKEALVKIYHTIEDISHNVENKFEKVDIAFKEVENHLDAVLDDIQNSQNQIFDKIDELQSEVKQEMRNIEVEKIISNIKLMLAQFFSRTEELNKLPVPERISQLESKNDILQYLEDSRVPKQDTLYYLLSYLIKRKFVIPRNKDDNLSIAMLHLLCSGVETYVYMLSFVLQQYALLSDNYYRKNNVEKYNHYYMRGVNTFFDFSNTLTGKIGLLYKVIRVLRTVGKLDFIQGARKDVLELISTKMDKYKPIQDSLDSNKKHFQFEIPNKMNPNLDFSLSNISIPIADWKSGAKVSYAMHMLGNSTVPFSMISPWSTGYTLDKLANPAVPIYWDNLGRPRVIFRKIGNGEPQIVATVQDSAQQVFRDIDRDLFNAACELNEDFALKNIRIYTANEANVNAEFENNKRSIHASAENNRWKIAQELIKHGADINAIDVDGYSPLHIATELGHGEFVEELLKLNVDVNIPLSERKHKLTPLHTAVYKGHVEIVKKLLRVSSININAQTTDGFSPLHYATYYDNKEIIPLFFNHNQINIDVKSTKIDIPLSLSTNDAFDEQAESLVHSGNVAPLHLASAFGSVDVLNDMLQKSSDIKTKTKDGSIALHFAAFNKDKSIISSFKHLDLEDIVDTQNDQEITPLYYAYYSNSTEVASKLVDDQCANQNIRLSNHKTLLHLAAIYGHTSAAENLVVHAKIDVSATDALGRTPLHYAVWFGDEQLIDVLLGNGASPNAVDKEGIPASHMAINLNEEKALAVIIQMTKMKLDVNLKGPHDNTLLHLFCTLEYLTVVKHLLEHKADVNAVNENIENNSDYEADLLYAPLMIASWVGNYELIDLLVKHGARYYANGEKGSISPISATLDGKGTLKIIEYLEGKFPNETIPWYGDTADSIKYLNLNSDIFLHFESRDPTEKSTLFGWATEYGNLFVLKYALNGTEFSPKKTCGTTLYDILFNGLTSYDIVQYMLDTQNAGLTTDKDCESLLHRALLHVDHTNVAELLVERGVESKTGLKDGTSELHLASKRGLNGIVNHLLNNGFKDTINTKDAEGTTPLYLAVDGDGNLDLVKTLIKEGANLDGDSNGNTLLNVAANRNKTEVAEHFIDNIGIIDPSVANKDGVTPLHYSAMNNNVDIVTKLLSLGKVDINAETINKTTPIYEAIRHNGEDKIIGIFLDNRAKIKHFDPAKCENLVSLAIEQEKFEIAKILIGNDADIQKAGVSKKTPIYAAIDADNPELVKMLLVRGADYNLPGPNGTAPIDLLLDNKSNTIKFFAYDYRNDQYQTMLHLMASQNKDNVVQTLLERGAYVNAQDKEGNSPLHLAAKNGHLAAVKMMCDIKQKCLNVELKNANKQTALDLAKSANKTTVVDYLEHNCHPKQRARRQIVEQFSEQPVSSSAGRPSWWVSDLIGSVVGTFGSITNQACQSVLSPSYYESCTASAQSISSLSASVNVHSTLLLLDVLARKFTGQSYVDTNSQSVDPLDVRSTSLVIVEQFERMLSRLSKEANSQRVSELDSFELFRSVEHCFLSVQNSKINQILLSTARDAFASDSVDDSLLVMSVEELLNEVLLGKKDSSLVETSSM